MCDAKCPECRGGLAAREEGLEDGGVEVYAQCDDCGWCGPSKIVGYHDTRDIPDAREAVVEWCQHLAYFDPRHRLPTLEEFALLRVKHGPDAFVQYVSEHVDMGRTRPIAVHTVEHLEGERAAYRALGGSIVALRVTAHLADGRPVAWPSEPTR